MTRSDEVFGRIVDDEVKRLLNDFGAEADRLEGLRERFTEIRGQGEAAGGQVVARALPSGALAGLEIDPRAMRLGSDELADAILDAAREAAEDAADQMTEQMSDAMTPFFGDLRRFTEGL